MNEACVLFVCAIAWLSHCELIDDLPPACINGK